MKQPDLTDEQMLNILRSHHYRHERAFPGHAALCNICFLLAEIEKRDAEIKKLMKPELCRIRPFDDPS